MGTVRACPGGWSREWPKRNVVVRRCEQTAWPPHTHTAQLNLAPLSTRETQSETPKTSESGVREIMAFTASRVVSGFGGRPGTGQRVRCFEDRLLVTHTSGVLTLPFRQITHAELDGRCFSVKLHLGMLDGFGPAYPPGLLRIELQNAADLALLRQAVWPLLMRAVLQPRENQSVRCGSLSRGPSLVWSHA